MKQIPLVIERNADRFVGRVYFENDLIIADEPSLEKLELKVTKLLSKFHNVNPDNVLFKHSYDLSSLFEKFRYLKISSIAKIAGINPSLLRQYVIGNKQASEFQAKRIETAIKKIGKELQNVNVYSSVKR